MEVEVAVKDEVEEVEVEAHCADVEEGPGELVHRGVLPAVLETEVQLHPRGPPG